MKIITIDKKDVGGLVKMAKERGWWKIEFTTEPNTTDLEHIAQLVEQGYTEGEIIKDEVM